MDFKEIIPPAGKWNKVEIKESPGKGLGVFTVKDIKKGEALCWYDGICCGFEDQIWANVAPVFITGKSGYNQNVNSGNNFTHKIYNHVLAGTTNGFRKGGVASLINDYSTTNDPNIIRKNLKEKRYNCDKQIRYDGKEFRSYIVFAERNISKGEELFVCYGHMYWTNLEMKWKDSDILNLVHKQNEMYNQEHNTLQDYKRRAEIVKTLNPWW